MYVLYIEMKVIDIVGPHIMLLVFRWACVKCITDVIHGGGIFLYPKDLENKTPL